MRGPPFERRRGPLRHYPSNEGAWHPRRHRQRRFGHPHGPLPLHKVLFWSFGVAILTTMMATWCAFALLRRFYGPGPLMPVVGMLVAANVIWWLSGLAARRLARPLRALARVANELGAGKLDQRVDLARGPSEIRELGGAFNDMASRIEAQVKSQKELLGAVSHELRTPLARLRVLVGSLGERGADERMVANMEREILELDALVGELLAGARVDAGALTKRSLDVADILTVCLERADRQEAQVSLMEGAEQVEADATLLSRALMVLLDNARKHGGKQLWLSVERTPDGTRFCVEDDGAGFDPEDLPRLFSPFARGRGETPDEHRGLGLGLYLVRRIAEAHGGQTFAENREQGGAAVGFTIG